VEAQHSEVFMKWWDKALPKLVDSAGMHYRSRGPSELTEAMVAYGRDLGRHCPFSLAYCNESDRSTERKEHSDTQTSSVITRQTAS